MFGVNVGGGYVCCGVCGAIVCAWYVGGGVEIPVFGRGGARMPAVKIAARPLPVTDREREIAELIAAGLTNKEIAEQLTLSIRTVEGHVYRACYKLGVADRDELAELISVEPLK